MCAGPINGKKPRRKSDELVRSSRIQKVKRSSFSSTGSTASASAISNRSKHSTQRETLSGRWVHDADCRECRNCHKSFSLMTRRHHCRICGQIFCNACSRTRMVLSTSPDEIPRRRRVCDPCAAHANESVFKNGSISLRKTSFDFSERSTDIVVPSDIDLQNPFGENEEAATLHFLVISLVCFLGAFWFLKDEVSYSNPALWMVIAGCIKNMYDLGNFLKKYYQQNGGKSLDVDEGEYPVNERSVVDADSAVQPQVGLRLSEEQKVQMLSNAHKAMDKLWELGSTSEGWTSEAPQTEQTADVHLFSRDNKPVRIYKCTAEIDLSPDELYDILYNGFETSTWNVTVMENKVLNVLNENTDVVHMVTKPCLGGMVTSRDFVNTRTWRKQNGGYVIGSVCAGKNLLKSGKGITRGVNGPTGFIILPHEESDKKCNFTWVLDCDIKGFFPGSVIKKGTLSEMWCFVRNLRRHMAKMKNADDANTMITATPDATGANDVKDATASNDTDDSIDASNTADTNQVVSVPETSKSDDTV